MKDKSITLKTQISIGKYLKRNINQNSENSKGPKKNLFVLEDIKI